MSPRMMSLVLKNLGETVSFFTRSVRDEARTLKGGKEWNMADDDQIEQVVKYVQGLNER